MKSVAKSDMGTKLLLLGIILFASGNLFAETITISEPTRNSYTVTPGNTLSVTVDGQLLGTVTLRGGTISNSGIINPALCILDSGTFNNYSEVYYDNDLDLRNNTVFRNLGSGAVWLSGGLKVGISARYLSAPSARLYVGGGGAMATTPSPSYAIPAKTLNGATYYASKNVLKCKYYEEYNDSDGLVTFTIYDKDRNLVGNGTRAVVPGVNQLFFVTTTLTTGQYYILELKNEKKETWKLRFKKF